MPDEGKGAFAAGGDALLTVALVLLGRCAAIGGAVAAAFAFAATAGWGSFLDLDGTEGAGAGFAAREVDVGFAATFGAESALPRPALPTTFAMARVADFTMLNTDDAPRLGVGLRGDAAALLTTLPGLLVLATDFATGCFDTGFFAALAIAFTGVLLLAFVAKDFAGGLAIAFAACLLGLAANLPALATANFAAGLDAGLPTLALSAARAAGLAASLPLATGGFAAEVLRTAGDTLAAAFATVLAAAAFATVLAGAFATVLVGDFAGLALLALETATLVARLTGDGVLALDLLDVAEVFDFAATLSPSLLDCLSHGGRVL